MVMVGDVVVFYPFPIEQNAFYLDQHCDTFHPIYNLFSIYLFQYFSVQQAVLFCCHDKVVGVILKEVFDIDSVNFI